MTNETNTPTDTDTAIPAGWKLVPIDPTGAMIEAARGMFPAPAYRAMLAASPKPDTDTAIPGGEVHGWKCNNCQTVFTSPQLERKEGDTNGGPSCPYCKAHGQYTYRYHTDTAIPAGGGLSERALHWRLVGLAANLRSEEFDEDHSSALDVEEAVRRLAAKPIAGMDAAQEAAVDEFVDMLSVKADDEGVTTFDHTPEEIGLHVMENHEAFLAALNVNPERRS